CRTKAVRRGIEAAASRLSRSLCQVQYDDPGRGALKLTDHRRALLVSCGFLWDMYFRHVLVILFDEGLSSVGVHPVASCASGWVSIAVQLDSATGGSFTFPLLHGQEFTMLHAQQRRLGHCRREVHPGAAVGRDRFQAKPVGKVIPFCQRELPLPTTCDALSTGCACSALF